MAQIAPGRALKQSQDALPGWEVHLLDANDSPDGVQEQRVLENAPNPGGQ